MCISGSQANRHSFILLTFWETAVKFLVQFLWYMLGIRTRGWFRGALNYISLAHSVQQWHKHGLNSVKSKIAHYSCESKAANSLQCGCKLCPKMRGKPLKITSRTKWMDVWILGCTNADMTLHKQGCKYVVKIPCLASSVCLISAFSTLTICG